MCFYIHLLILRCVSTSNIAANFCMDMRSDICVTYAYLGLKKSSEINLIENKSCT